MRSLDRLFVFIISIAFLTGCSDSNVPDSYHASLSGHSLNISNNRLSFESTGGVENVTVHANNVAWRFAGLPGWLTASPNSGSSTTSVAFTASENLSADTARTAMFYLESADASWSFRTMVSATQQAAASYITPASTSLTFQGSGGSQTINITSNVTWKPTSSASWAKAEASQDGKTLTISAEENPSDASRTATITLSSANGISSSVNIIQEPAGVSGSTETLEFDKEGGSKSISITADAAWEIKTSDSWITVSPSSGGVGSHNLSISALENNSTSERTGYVYVNIGGSSKLQIPIVQKGLFLEAKPTSLSFSADTESKQLEINSNTDWSITSLPEWLSASSLSGKNNQTISLTAQNNSSASSRNGKVKIEKEGLTLSAIVEVQQEGLSLSVDNNNLQFGANASTQEVVINTISSWSASSSEGWITLSQTSGTGKSTLSISVEENKGDNSRTGSVKIVAGELHQTITITQQGKYFNISESDKMFTSKGGTLQISFSTNDNWNATVSDNASWLTLSSTNGSGDAIIDITAGDNASMKSRECTVTITPSNGQGAKVRVKQDGKYLTVDTEKLTFNTAGGTSKLVKISTDGTFEVSVTDSWMRIKEKSNESFRLEVDGNEGKSRQGRVLISMVDLAGGETYKLSISVEQDGNEINGHEYVDLGLPSGLKWATMNVGANSMNSRGDYYAWGEVETKSTSNYATYKYCNNGHDFTKYCTDSSYGTPDGKKTLEIMDDVASVKWGGTWRMPTEAEFKELLNNCSISQIANGIKLTGPNGKTIVFCAGYSGYLEVDKVGRYWTSSLSSEFPGGYYATAFEFNLNYYKDYYNLSYKERVNSYQIRPVSK